MTLSLKDFLLRTLLRSWPESSLCDHINHINGSDDFDEEDDEDNGDSKDDFIRRLMMIIIHGHLVSLVPHTVLRLAKSQTFKKLLVKSFGRKRNWLKILVKKSPELIQL